MHKAPHLRLKPTERLAAARAPDGTILTLYRHDTTYGIRVGSEELMSTRRYHSEEALAEVVCGAVGEKPGARALIGGLGLGFTLGAALRALPVDARVVVAEIVPEVIEWNRNPDYPFAAESLADPRVEILEDDVLRVMRRNPGVYDAIMLDVDNGAEALTTGGNADLYAPGGIRATVAALRRGGRVAYWSAGQDPRFEAALRRAGLEVHPHRVRAHRSSAGRHTLLVGRRPA